MSVVSCRFTNSITTTQQTCCQFATDLLATRQTILTCQDSLQQVGNFPVYTGKLRGTCLLDFGHNQAVKYGASSPYSVEQPQTHKRRRAKWYTCNVSFDHFVTALDSLM